MAYRVVRVPTVAGGGFVSRFKPVENDDTDFPMAAYPELDDYLSELEQRGWSVVSTTGAVGTQGTYLYVTLHQPDAVGGQPE